jgi:DNA polymerase-3 subunit epsilon
LGHDPGVTDSPLPLDALGPVFELCAERPLAVFDLETTGTDRLSDRIVEVAVVRFGKGGQVATLDRRVNPGVKIPRESTRVHGISDADVAECPAFAALAPELVAFLDGCDLAGYNVRQFDVPVLLREFELAKVPFSMDGRRVVDMQTIYFRREPRDLAAAVRFFAGREHVAAHAALADAVASAEVLAGQLRRYADLPRDVAALHDLSRPPEGRYVDPDKRFLWRDGEVVFAFGQHRGTRLADVAEKNPSYLDWIVDGNFPDEAKRIARDAQRGVIPRRD